MPSFDTLQQDPAHRGDAPIPTGVPTALEERGGRGRWPRMLNLDADTEDRLKKYLGTEIEQARIEKQPLIENWKDWQNDYWAEPAQEVKNWPFKRAANIVVPLTATAVEAIYARLMNTIHAVEPFWSIRPRSKTWIDAAKPVERWLQTKVEEEESLSVFEMSSNALLELVKLGTCIGKSGYERDIRKSIRERPDGTDEEIWHERKNGATLDWVPNANFLMRMAEQDPQEASWCGEEHEFTWVQLKRMAGSGRMDPDAIEEIKHQWISSRVESTGDAGDYHEELDELVDTEPLWHAEFKTQEIWLSFDVDGDGRDEEIVVDFHWNSRTILSVRYNWYDDLRRPYRITQYIKVEGRWPGIGVGKVNEQFQSEVTTIRRQRLDNATLANMRMLAIKKSSGYGPGEPVFPGKMWFVDDTDDIKPIQMSEIYQSSVVNEQAVVRDSEKRTGVNEVLLGMPEEGTPGTATGDLARIAEGNKRFDLVLKSVRRWFSLLGQDVLMAYQQFGNQRLHFVLEEEEGEWVERVLTMPATLVSRGAIIDLTATDTTANRQVEQQQWMGLHQTLTQYFRQILELGQILLQLQVIDPQQFGQMALRAIRSADETTKRLLETFNVTDAERLLFLPEEQTSGPGAQTQQRQAQPGGRGPNGGSPRAGGGRAGGLQGPAGPSGLASLLEAAQSGSPQQNGGTDLSRLASRGVPNPGRR